MFSNLNYLEDNTNFFPYLNQIEIPDLPKKIQKSLAKYKEFAPTYLVTETFMEQKNSRRGADGVPIPLGYKIDPPFLNKKRIQELKPIKLPLSTLSLKNGRILNELNNVPKRLQEKPNLKLKIPKSPLAKTPEKDVFSPVENQRRKSLNDIEPPNYENGRVDRRMTPKEQREHTKRVLQGLSPKRTRGRKPDGFYKGQ